MKSTFAAPGGLATSLFDLLAAGLAGHASERSRAGAIDAPRPSLLERIERSLWQSRQREIERYLASSVDIVDLEARMRRLERRG